MRRARAAAVLAAVFALAASGEPVPMFHGGPDHSGRVEDSAVPLRPGWRFTTGGALIGSPVLAQGILYQASEDGFLYAINADSGQLLWRYDASARLDGTPAVGLGRVFFIGHGGALEALDAASGRPAWRFATGGERRHAAAGVDGMAPGGEMMPDPWDMWTSAPTLDGGMVLFGSGDGHVYALDPGTGKPVWAFDTHSVVHASPSSDGRSVFVGDMDGVFHALDLHTGKALWSFATGKDPDQHLLVGIPGSVLVAEGKVIFGARDAHVYALDAASGAKIWSADTGTSWVVATPARDQGTVLVPTSDSTQFLALSIANGHTLWKLETRTPGFSSPALAGGHAYFGTMDGILHDVDLAKHAFAGEWRTAGHDAHAGQFLTAAGHLRNAVIWSGPTLDDGIIGIRTRMFSLGSLVASPAIGGGRLFIGSTDGTLYAFGAAETPAPETLPPSPASGGGKG